jgi:hypothetical protein
MRHPHLQSLIEIVEQAIDMLVATYSLYVDMGAPVFALIASNDVVFAQTPG